MTSTVDVPTLTDLPVWEQRYRAARISLPAWADDAPQRCLYLSNIGGRFEVYSWDRGTDQAVKLTDRANGTSHGALTPDGEHVWWFNDTDGDEYGVWMRQPFGVAEADAAEVAVPGLDPSYIGGLALRRDGLAVVGRAGEFGTQIHLCRPGQSPRTIYANECVGYVCDLSRDGSLLGLVHDEHGDSRHMAARVLRLHPDDTVTTVADLWDGEGKGVDLRDFSPVEGDPRVLVEHERRGRPEMLIWNPVTGEQHELVFDLPGEIGAQWYQDGQALLIDHNYAARCELYRYELDSGTLTPLEIPQGTVMAATTRPDGTVEYSWSSSELPTQIRSTTAAVVLVPPGPAVPPSVPVTDAWVEGPGGRIHALISRPVGAQGALPTVFSIHGGPAVHDTDSFTSDTAAWVDQGYAVVRVNYRGSSGYGSAWRDANEGRPGLTELEDIAAVVRWCVEAGITDPHQTVITGGSWGGYLTLLTLGMHPELWTVGVAAVPVADYVAAYEDEPDTFKAFDDALFGGSPTEVPEAYRVASPLTYIEQVRAPVLIIAGENDPRCPIRQINNYVARLSELDKPYQMYRFDAGHGSLVTDERVKQQRASMEFVAQHLGVAVAPLAMEG